MMLMKNKERLETMTIKKGKETKGDSGEGRSGEGEPGPGKEETERMGVKICLRVREKKKDRKKRDL